MSSKAIHWTDPMDDGTPPVASSPAELPEWLAARRERRSAGTPAKTSDAPAMAPAAPMVVAPAATAKVAPPPVLPTVSTPLKRPPRPNSKADAMVIEAAQQLAADDPSYAHWLRRWLTSNGPIGWGGSLLIHATVLIALAFVLFSKISQRDEISLFGVANEGDELGSELLIDTTIAPDGGESGPVQTEEMAQASELTDASGLIPEKTELGLAGITGGPMADGLGGKGHGKGEAGNGNGIGPPALRVPGHAQNKGSFSAWTDPRDPDPNEPYFIVIQIRLPRNVSKYRASDLSGSVTGTDKYFQKIPAEPNEQFAVEDGRVEIRILVPGGDKKVRDTIQIASKVLKEKQTFKIEF